MDGISIFAVNCVSVPYVLVKLFTIRLMGGLSITLTSTLRVTPSYDTLHS